MSKTLVTGASGFIGTHLCRALVDRGDTVTCLVRSSSKVEPLQALGARLYVGDVTEPDSVSGAVAGQDMVYHLAGRTRASTLRQFCAVNASGARAVARACAARSTPPVVVGVSSLAVAGPSDPGRPHTESAAPAPVSYYGRSKAAGERALAAIARQVPVTIVRPPIVFGGGDRAGFPLFASIARFRFQATPTCSKPRFSMVHVADLVALLLAAGERGQRLQGGHNGVSCTEVPNVQDASNPTPAPAASTALATQRSPWGQHSHTAPEPQKRGIGIYYVSGGPALTLGEFSCMIAGALGRRRVLLIPVPSPITWSVAALMEAFARISGRPANLNLDKAREATAGNWACSAEKAARELGFQPAAPLEARVRQTVAWYREAHWI